VLLLLTACAAAWRPDAPGRFDLAVPTGWEITRNKRFFGNDFLTLASRDLRSTITVELVRSDPAARRLPLDLLAEVRALSMGRTLGVESTRVGLHQIDVDDHEAWAVTGSRRTTWSSADYSTIIAWVGPHLAQITLTTPAGELDRALPAWAGFLASVRFPLDPLPADRPLFDPELD
jgi:hypothetical protein